MTNPAPSVETAPADAPAAKRGGPPKPLVAVLALGLAGAGYYAATHYGREATDDAQIEADVVAVPARVAGVVARVLVADDAELKAGDVIAELDPTPLDAKVAQARAAVAVAEAQERSAVADVGIARLTVKSQRNIAEASLQGASIGTSESREQIAEAAARVASAEASYGQAKADFERAQQLFGLGAISKQQFDLAKTGAEQASANVDVVRAALARLRASAKGAEVRVKEASAREEQVRDVDAYLAQAEARAAVATAQVTSAKAALALAELDRSFASIVAPQAGVFSRRSIAVGQNVVAGQGVGSLVPNDTRWVVANYKETQIVRMAKGQSVRVRVDAYRSREFEGVVDSFSAGTGARFSLMPPDNASGNFTKVVQRVPVRIRLENLPQGVALRPGLSVEAVVDVRRAP